MKGQIREVRIVDLITYLFLPLFFLLVLWIGGTLLAIFVFPFPSWIFFVVAAVTSYFLIKRAALGTVLAYKAWAPLDVRGKCRFEPTCSTYMILAIKKYGLIRGIIKGIKRIKRCKPPNGGIDYP
jgi:putative membrane protein insertion efficiency factor